MLLIAGDLVLGKKGASVHKAYEFLREAVKLFPVFYSLGNHEQRMKQQPEIYGKGYLMLEKKLRRIGVVMLENTTRIWEGKGEKVLLTGLMLPYSYYARRGKQRLEKRDLNHLGGKSVKGGVSDSSGAYAKIRGHISGMGRRFDPFGTLSRRYGACAFFRRCGKSGLATVSQILSGTF